MKVEPSRVVIASLLLATSARAQTAHVRDVTPDMGIVFQGFFSEGFARLLGAARADERLRILCRQGRAHAQS